MRRFVFACLIAACCAAMAPTVASAGDQEITQYIIQKLSVAKEQGELKGFDLDLYVDNGTVWLKGQVNTEAQKKLVLSTAQSGKSLGVTQVVDEITISTARPTVERTPVTAESSRRSGSTVQQTQHQQAIPRAIPASAAPRSSMPLAVNQPPQGMMGGAPAYLPAGGGAPAGAYYDQPQMPAYAWPSYAAHPNYSAVSYPTQYSPTAWPYIGPFYPYPQVPLGWRKVTLEWDDGWWMLDFHDR